MFVFIVSAFVFDYVSNNHIIMDSAIGVSTLVYLSQACATFQKKTATESTYEHRPVGLCGRGVPTVNIQVSNRRETGWIAYTRGKGW